VTAHRHGATSAGSTTAVAEKVAEDAAQVAEILDADAEAAWP